ERRLDGAHHRRRLDGAGNERGGAGLAGTGAQRRAEAPALPAPGAGMSHTRTALIADEQPMFRAGLAAALRRAGIEVVAETSNTAGAVAAAAELSPSVCVLGAGLPGGALAATKRITARAPEALVVVLGPAEDDETLVAAVRAGASGYLPRSTSVRGLARAIEAVLDG